LYIIVVFISGQSYVETGSAETVPADFVRQNHRFLMRNATMAQEFMRFAGGAGAEIS
jgi:hypothetical protein